MKTSAHRATLRSWLEPQIEILRRARFNPSKWSRGFAVVTVLGFEVWYLATADIRVGLALGGVAFYVMRDTLGNWNSDPTRARCRAIVALDIAVFTILVGIVANVARYGVGPWDAAAAVVAVAYVLVTRSVRGSIPVRESRR